jgi:hypothetical protein
MRQHIMKLRLIASALLFLGFAVAPVSAHDELGFVGTLVKVDIAKNRVTVKYKENLKDEVIDIVLTPKTAITQNKQKVAKSALKVGVSVVIRALGCEDQDPEATEIRIVPAISRK